MSNLIEDTEVIDSLYAVTTSPHGWGVAMRTICEHAGFVSADVFHSVPGIVSIPDTLQGHYSCGEGEAPGYDEYIQSIDPLVRTLGVIEAGQAVVTNQLVGGFEQCQFYREYLLPKGARAEIVIVIEKDANLFSCVRFGLASIANAFIAQEFVQQLFPHLRAAIRAKRQILTSDSCTNQVLSLLQAPPVDAAALIDKRGYILWKNHRFESVTARHIGVSTEHGYFQISDQEKNLFFSQCLGSLQQSSRGIHLALPSPNGRPFELAVYWVQTKGVGNYDSSNGPCCMIFVRDPNEQRFAPSGHYLQTAYDLTPAETRVALKLSGGESITDIAENLGTEVSTVRSHLARIYRKADVRGQAELVNIVRGNMEFWGTDERRSDARY